MRRGPVSVVLTLALLALGAGGGCAPSLSDARSTSGDPGPHDAGDAALEVAGAAGGTPGAGGAGGTPGAGGVGGASAPAGLTAADLVGNWSGRSSIDRPLAFTVDASGLVGWSIGWQLPTCGSTTTGTFPPAAIVDGQVTRTLAAGPGGASLTVTIAFSSPSAATRSFDFAVTQPPAGGCSGHGTATFTATRDP